MRECQEHLGKGRVVVILNLRVRPQKGPSKNNNYDLLVILLGGLPHNGINVLNHLSWIFNPILFITIHDDLPDFLAGCRFSTRHQFQVLICHHECHIMLSYLDIYRRNRKTMKNLQQLLGRRTTNPCAARGQASELSQASRRFRWTVLDRGITRNWAGQRCQLRERLQNGCTSPGRCHANQESMGGKNKKDIKRPRYKRYMLRLFESQLARWNLLKLSRIDQLVQCCEFWGKTYIIYIYVWSSMRRLPKEARLGDSTLLQSVSCKEKC